ncbi:outer membrane precursor protein Lom [Escherichia coli]|uniref:Ail/Lom family outer membrane beta-barrel protein n=1 Tax=Escherichia coli TaxID=562 RepID=UPI0010CAEF9C|nr:Ail/Lom family outer membrane beta-barrel protein [Escherichia coli]GCW32903.1 outer membrane precursor protein Lom [Escherichia coli]
MKSIMKFFACAVLVMSCLTAQVNAASGDSTVSLGFAHIRFPGLKDFVRDAGVYNRDTFRNVVNVNHFNSSAEYENAIARGHDGTAKSPLGMSIRYRYEITDELGVIASFTWARSMTNAQAFIDVKPSDPSREVKNPAASARTDIRANYWSLLSGPSWRFNEYLSVYAMAGMGVAKVTTDLKINDNLNHGAGSFSESNSTKKTSIAWSVGAQFNFNESVAMDVAYESSGSGDWRTSGVVVGIGLKF